KPEADYAWTRMPNFKLSADEARNLAAYLDAYSTSPKGTPAPKEPSLIMRGKKLVQTSGCLNCHALKLENQFSTKSLIELTPQKWVQGCLALSNQAAVKSPQFAFSDLERQALQAFA